MAKWDEQLYFEDVEVGEDIAPVSIPISLTRLVMAAGGNRDFMPMHHDGNAARQQGQQMPTRIPCLL